MTTEMNRKAEITVKVDNKLGTISPMLYGVRCFLQFSEQKNLIWVGEDSEIPNIEGIRKDTVEALNRISPGFITAIGGTFYHWQDGIGTRDKRPVRACWWARSPFESMDLEWRMDFGTDEFIRFCRLSGAEPMMICNEDEPEESRNWIEYCNYEGESNWTKLRIANGQKEPYKVKYWKVYGWLDLDPEIYAMQYRKFALHARLIDPSIKLIAAGGIGDNWDRKLFEILDRCTNPNLGGTALIDYLGKIIYTGQSFPEVDYNDWEYYRVIQNSVGLDTHIRSSLELIDKYTKHQKPWGSNVWGFNWIGRTDIGTPQILLAYLEWGTRHTLHRQTMREAIAHAYMLDAFHRWANRAGIASHWVNMLLQCDNDKLWVTPTYHLFEMYMPHRNNKSVAVDVDCELIVDRDVAREVDFAGGIAFAELPPLPVISSSASISPDRNKVVISITNCHLTDSIEAQVNIVGLGKPLEGKLGVLTSESVRNYNNAENPDKISLKVHEFTPEGESFTTKLNPYSVNTLVLKIKK